MSLAIKFEDNTSHHLKTKKKNTMLSKKTDFVKCFRDRTSKANRAGSITRA